MKPVGLVRKGRRIVLNLRESLKQRGQKYGCWKLFSQFPDAQSMMQRFSNKVARLNLNFLPDQECPRLATYYFLIRGETAGIIIQ